MNTAKTGWSRRYQKALHKHSALGRASSLKPAVELGRQAVALGLETLDLTRIHKQALMDEGLPGGSPAARQRMSVRANGFFSETIVPIEQTHRAAQEANVRVHRLIRTLRRRTTESATSTRNLERGIAKRQAVEAALKKSGKRRLKLLEKSVRLQKHLRNLIRRVLLAQEDERQKTSRHLHDEIAQTLVVINLRLLMLRQAAMANTKNLKKEIANTQQLVRKSRSWLTVSPL